MSGFIYNGKSTKDILASSELVLCSTDGGFDNVMGVERELLGGEPTVSRPIVNEYGTNANHLEFRYSLMKANGDDFTDAEQRTVESWLTSPKFSSELQLFDCDDVVKYHYYGKFRLTSWEVSQDTFCAVNFIFAVNGSYCFERHLYNASSEGRSGEWRFTIDCPSDELEEYVYPKIILSRYSGSALYGSSVSMTLINYTDSSNRMVITTTRNDDFYIDCQHCILSEDSGLVKFSELGWSDVGNIYWPRLQPGENTFGCIGDVNLLFEFDVPVKLVGGWLV